MLKLKKAAAKLSGHEQIRLEKLLNGEEVIFVPVMASTDMSIGQNWHISKLSHLT